MGKIRLKDLVRIMKVPEQDLIFKLRSIGVRLEGDDPLIDSEIIQAILQGKRLPQPKEVILPEEITSAKPAGLPAQSSHPSDTSRAAAGADPKPAATGARLIWKPTPEEALKWQQLAQQQASRGLPLPGSAPLLGGRDSDSHGRSLQSDSDKRPYSSTRWSAAPVAEQSSVGLLPENRADVVSAPSVEVKAKQFSSARRTSFSRAWQRIPRYRNLKSSPPKPSAEDLTEKRQTQSSTLTLNQLRSNLESIEKALQSVVGRLQETEQKIETLEGRSAESKKWPEKFAILQRRVLHSQTRRHGPSGPNWRITSKNALATTLKERDIFLLDETISDLWMALSTKRIIVLEGVPGTGKSRLAKALPEVLLTPHPTQNSTYIELPARPELTSDQLIGDRTAIARHIGPDSGPLLNAILNSHEARHGFWLIIDEINRCNLDELFAPLLDAFSQSDGGAVHHSYMFPDQEIQEAKIPIPASFRILGTMNPLDRGLFEISQALRQRIQFVNIPILDKERENLMVRREIRRLLPESTSGHDYFEDQTNTTALAQLQDVALQIRSLVARRPQSQFAPCALGSRLVIEAMRRFIIKKNYDLPKEIPPIELTLVLDSIVRSVYLEQLSLCGTEALHALTSEVFQQELFPKTRERLEELFLSRKI